MSKAAEWLAQQTEPEPTGSRLKILNRQDVLDEVEIIVNGWATGKVAPGAMNYAKITRWLRDEYDYQTDAKSLKRTISILFPEQYAEIQKLTG